MFRTTILIEPNEKYGRVLGLHEPAQESDTDTDAEEIVDDYDDWPDEHKEAADDYIELVADAPTPEDFDSVDEEEMDVLTWDDISPSSDPDLLSKIATYFEGMQPDDPTDEIRAKCRLLDVDVYANAQVAAQQELRGQ